MKLFELLESVEKITVGSMTLTVFKNPSFEQVEHIINHMIKYNKQEFPHLRGYVDPETNDYYVWDANYAIHFEVARELGLEYTWKNRCDIVVTTQSEVRLDYTEDFLLKTPNVARINRSLPNFKFTSELPILENTTELLESVTKVFVNGTTLLVYKNPSFDQIDHIFNTRLSGSDRIEYNRGNEIYVRGIVDPDTNDYYIWNPRYVIHFYMAQELGIKYEDKNRCNITFTPSENGFKLILKPFSESVANTPNVARIKNQLPNFVLKESKEDSNQLPILENTIRTTDETGETFVVTHNPTRQQFQKMISNPEADMKAWLGPKDIWIWPAWHAHHHQIANNFGLSPQDDNLHTIFIRNNGILVMTYDKKPFKNHPILNRLYGPNYTVG